MILKYKVQNDMKKAYIEQMLMWLVIFMAFVWTFIFIIDYGSILRIKDNLDDISEYASYSQAKGLSQDKIITGINKLSRGIEPVISSNYNCVDSTTVENHQVTFNIISSNTFKGNILHKDGITIQSSKTKFNPMEKFNTTCTLNVKLK